MSDLIRREDALDAIYGVVTTVSVCLTAEEAAIRTDTRKRCEDAVASVPAVDAVEVVRCKDCVRLNRGLALGAWSGSCGYWNTHSVMDDWYCAQGARKDGGENNE